MKLNLKEYYCPMPGGEGEEEIVIFARRHWVSFIWAIIVIPLIILFPILLIILVAYYVPNFFGGFFMNFFVLGLSIYYLVSITFSLTAWVSFYYDIYVVTKDTIIDVHQQGFFDRKISQLSLLRVQDVSSMTRGFFPTLFAYGDVLVETAGEQKEHFLFESVPNPQEFSAKVLELHNNLIEEQSRLKDLTEGEGVLEPRGEIRKTEDDKVLPINPMEKVEEVTDQETEELQPAQKTAEPKEPEVSSGEATKEKEGDISQNNLNKGGEVKF